MRWGVWEFFFFSLGLEITREKGGLKKEGAIRAPNLFGHPERKGLKQNRKKNLGGGFEGEMVVLGVSDRTGEDSAEVRWECGMEMEGR